MLDYGDNYREQSRRDERRAKILGAAAAIVSMFLLGISFNVPAIPVADNCTHCHNETTWASGGKVILDGEPHSLEYAAALSSSWRCTSPNGGADESD